MKERLFLAFLLLFLCFLVVTQQKVVVFYFRNDKCGLIGNTDRLIEEAKKAFNGRIEVKVYNVSIYPSDPPDTEEVKALREKYGVLGVPVIVINGKEFKEEFTRENLFKAICNNYILKPEVCI